MVELILEIHSHGHPSYACIDEEAVRRRAADLPETGIPSEVWKVVQKATSTHDKLQPQKAATPCDAMEGFEAAGKTFSVQRARAIVAEGESREEASSGPSTLPPAFPSASSTPPLAPMLSTRQNYKKKGKGQ